MDKNVKAMLKISDVIDNRYQKLCDRYHNLELSHNRKKKALFKILAIVTGLHDNLGLDDIIRETCEAALFCDGRERNNGKGVKNG